MLLFDLVNTLSSEEKKKFKSYLRKKNKRNDVKNLQLFEIVQQANLPKDIDCILYGKPSRNAFNALSKRLHDNLIDFIAQRSFETESSEELEVFKLLLSSRIFYEHNHDKLAKKTLRKAELKALDIDLYSGLSEIYHTQIQYAHRHSNENLSTLFSAFRQNQKYYQQQENLNMAYASIKQKLYQNDTADSLNLQELLREQFTHFQISLDDSFTFKSFYQLLEIINTAAHLEHNFATALPYFEKIHKQISLRKNQAIKHRYYYIHFLYYMANAYFRNRQFDISQEYLLQMQSSMLAEGGKYEARFRESELLLKALNLNYTGKAVEAIGIVEQHLKKTKVKNPDLVLLLSVCHVQQEDSKSGLNALNQLRHTDSWYMEKAGKDWLIKRDLLELIIHITLENLDLADALFKRFARKYKDVLKQEDRLQQFLRFIKAIHEKPEIVMDKGFRENVKAHFKSTHRKKEDIFMLSYFAWLRAKLNKTPLYQTTLELL